MLDRYLTISQFREEPSFKNYRLCPSHFLQKKNYTQKVASWFFRLLMLMPAQIPRWWKCSCWWKMDGRTSIKSYWRLQWPVLHISPKKLGNFQLFMRNFSLLMTTPSPRLQTTMWQIKRCGRRPKKLMVTNLAEVAQFEGRGESANQCSFPIFS